VTGEERSVSLSEELMRVPGVRGVEFRGPPERPRTVRVTIASGVDPEGVRRAVRAVLEGREPPTAARSEEVEVVAGEDELLESVAVEEGRDGIVVHAATSSGRRTSARAFDVPGAVDEAVARAVGALLGFVDPPPRLRAVDRRTLGGVELLEVVVEVLDGPRAGSCLVEVGRLYALGRAVWVALSCGPQTGGSSAGRSSTTRSRAGTGVGASTTAISSR